MCRRYPKFTLIKAALMTLVAFVWGNDASWAKQYDVGPGEKFRSVGEVPWGKLGPGDLVRVHWRKAPYREKILISSKGTALRPIRVVGVPGPGGEMPVLDGEDATTGPGIDYLFDGMQDRGLLVIAPSNGSMKGVKPEYVEVEGLHFRNAAPPGVFRDRNGKPRRYVMHAAAIFVERGEHITIRGCRMTRSSNGLFVASGAGEESQSRDILVEGNDIRDNGNPGRMFEHNVYTEAIGITFQFNHLGPPRSGAKGNSLKDRSAGTVIRYNWIEPGANLLDLVDPEESAAQALKAPEFAETLVYGNVMINGPGPQTSMVHFGGDSGKVERYRKQLRFYQNTVVIGADQTGAKGRWRTILFRLETNDQAVDARNNIIFCRPINEGRAATELALLDEHGRAEFGVNWVSPGWLLSPSGRGGGFSGTANGTKNFLDVSRNDPGFVELLRLDLHPRMDSAAVGTGELLGASPWKEHPADRQYLSPRSSVPRPTKESHPDLGAFSAVLGKGG